MATRLFCDICRKEIKDMDRRYDLDLKDAYFTEEISSSYYDEPPVHMDLCRRCYSDLLAVIKEMKDGTLYIEE